MLLQVVFHSDISEEAGEFDINDVITDLCKKLIIRHPHVFSDDSRYSDVTSSDQVLANWNDIKKQTKGQSTEKLELQGVSRALPSLYRGQKIAKKLRKAGHGIEEQTGEKLAEYERSADMDTLGALLLSVCASADKNGINAEEALYKAIEGKINEIG